MTSPGPERAAAWALRRTAPCFHHALLLQRAELHSWGEPQAEPALQAVLHTLGELRVDDEARALGLTSEHLTALRFALVALLAECAADQPGSDRWRDLLAEHGGLPRSANVGQEFFIALEQRLALPAPTAADLAVLQIHALCLLLGLRGRYGADIAAAESELQHQLRRLQLRLRPLLAPRPPPADPPVPLHMPPRTSRIPLLIAALLLGFTTLLISSLRTSIRSHADALAAHLQAHRP
jgi:type VI protein secretion system component VasF